MISPYKVVTNIRGDRAGSDLWVEPPTCHGVHVASELIISPTNIYIYIYIYNKNNFPVHHSALLILKIALDLLYIWLIKRKKVLNDKDFSKYSLSAVV